MYDKCRAEGLGEFSHYGFKGLKIVHTLLTNAEAVNPKHTSHRCKDITAVCTKLFVHI